MGSIRRERPSRDPPPLASHRATLPPQRCVCICAVILAQRKREQRTPGDDRYPPGLSRPRVPRHRYSRPDLAPQPVSRDRTIDDDGKQCTRAKPRNTEKASGCPMRHKPKGRRAAHRIDSGSCDLRTDEPSEPDEANANDRTRRLEQKARTRAGGPGRHRAVQDRESNFSKRKNIRLRRPANPLFSIGL